MTTKLLGPGLCAFALCACTLFAQQANNIPRTMHIVEQSQVHIPSEQPPALAILFGNLGSPTDTYNDAEGDIVAGPDAGLGITLFEAIPFTPKRNAKVMVVEAAIQYLFGDNQVNLSLYSDASGAPGTLVAGPFTVENLPPPGSCCQLAVWKLSAGVAVTGGDRYWIVADTPASGPGSNFAGLWNFIFPTPFPQAENTGSGWIAAPGGLEQFAVAVFGTAD